MPQDMSRTLEANLVDFHVHLSDAPAHDAAHAAKISVRNLDFWYGDKHALKDVSLDIFEREVVAFIGPSGCGKSTLLRCLNRSNDIVAEARMTGRVLMDGADIYAPDLDPPLVRRRFGWVAQKPNPFPRSIYENVAYGPCLHGLVSGRRQTDALVRDTLERVGLWGEVKDRLRSPGTDLSGGQQQRLCIARAIAIQPEVVLMDEPCSALDPNATMRIEALIAELRRDYAIVIITHNMQQAARVSQRVAVLHLGRLVEEGDAERVFSRPEHDITRSYLAGRFG